MQKKTAIAMACLSTGGSLLIAAAAANAQTAAALDTVVVTASGLPQRITDAIPHTTVLTESDIRNSGQSDLPGLLRGLAGFELTQNGGHGQTSSVFIRGSETRQVLVLVDGVRIGSVTLGSASLEQVPLDAIERVEIVRGNVSALYGSAAVGGVIQIFTRKGGGAPAPSAAAEIGSNATQRVSAAYRGAAGDTRFSVAASHYKTGSQSAIDPALAPNANPDRDPYRNTSFTASVVQRLSAAHELSASLYRQQGRAAYDNAFGAPTDTHQIDSRSTNLALGWKASLGPNWQSRVTLGANIDESDSRTNSDAPERVHTHSRQLDWRSDVALGAGQTASVGLGTAQQRVASDTAYDRTSRRTDSLTLGYNADVEAAQVQANLRHDRHSDVGAATTGLLGAGWRMTEAWKLLATVSTAFNAPTFNLLYFPGFGNPNLKPERARSAELGAQYASGTTLARVAWFDTRYRDLIDFPPPNFVPVNIATARVKGLEFSAGGELAGWRLRANATLQDPKDAAGDTLRRRARHFGSVDAARDFGAWRVQAGVVSSGARHDTDLNFNPVELSPYTLLSLSGGYRLAPELWLTARVTNATATNYSTVYAYPAPGRELHVGIAWRH